MEIRFLDISDLGPMSELYVTAFNRPPWNDGWTRASAEDRLSRFLRNPDALGVIAEDSEEILGFALGVLERWVDGEHFHLREMCTSPARQRAGIGGALLGALASELRRRGVRATYLQTRPDTAAADFFDKHGFQPLWLQLMARSDDAV